MFVLASQVLLIAVATASLVQMFLIAKYEEVRFTETNHSLLYTELAACALIVLFGAGVFVVQLRRLFERRREDRRTSESSDLNRVV